MRTKRVNHHKKNHKPRPIPLFKFDKLGVSTLVVVLVSLLVLGSIQSLQHNSLGFVTSGQSALGRFLAMKPKPNEIPSVGIWDANYDTIDAYAKSIQYSGSSVEELAKILSEYATTPSEKARIAYTWIAHNINYNVHAFLTQRFEQTSPQATLLSRQAVCSGYSILYQALTSEMGLKSVVIEGYAKGQGYGLGDLTDVNHAWNAVQIDQKWYPIDVTWGAGNLEGNQFIRTFDPFFFGAQPDQFLYTHFPIRDEWQLVAQPKTKAEFENTPDLSSEFFKNRLRLVSHFGHTIPIHNRDQVLVDAPLDLDVVAKYHQVQANQTSGQPPLEQVAKVYRSGSQFLIQLEPWSRVYDLIIYAKKFQDSGAYQEVARYKVVVS